MCHARRVAWCALGLIVGSGSSGAQRDRREPERLRAGVTVLLDDQVSLLRGRWIALIADAGARDDHGDGVDDVLRNDKRARAARIVVAASWRADSWPGTVGTPIGTAGDSAQRARLDAIADSLAGGAQAVVLDLLDGGVRTSAAPWIVLAALRAASRHRVPVIVLDRPNPLTGDHAEGPAADSSLGASDALYGLPARHGMTVGEIARWFNVAGAIGAALEVVPVRGWRRSMWPVDRGMRAMRPDGRVLAPEQLAMLGALAPLAATNIVVAPGPGRASVRVGAPWLDAKAIADLLNDRLMAGVKFRAGRDGFERSDGSLATMPCVTIEVTDRDRASGLRTLAAVLAAVRKAGGDSLRFDADVFDRLAVSPSVRRGVLADDDPDAIADAHLAAVVDFRRRVRGSLLYR